VIEAGFHSVTVERYPVQSSTPVLSFASTCKIHSSSQNDRSSLAAEAFATARIWRK